jgi:signal transduction histidine kinase
MPIWKRRARHSSYNPVRVPFFASVKFRLTRWYFTMLVATMFLFGGSFYGSQIHQNDDATNALTDTRLYEDAGQLSDAYRQQLLRNLPPAENQIIPPANEVVLLLDPSGTILDTRGPLTSIAIQELQNRAESSAPTSLTLPLQNGMTPENSDYRVLGVPILDQNTRIATLIIGHLRENPTQTWRFWLLHALVILLIAAFAGYWLAVRTMRPIQMITRTAQEINATDLRRRLNLKHNDEFGQLAATFDQMLARLDAAFKRQAQFTADASHELRTPLTIVNLEINRALTQLQTPEEFRLVLEQIQAENTQMAEIVNSLLLLARADTGQFELHREVIDLSDTALASVERLLPLAHQKQIKLSTGELPELLVSSDPQYLGRMMTNLLENAIKYTSGIGQRVHVDLAEEQGQWAILRVRDDGPGIAPEHLPFLFERFYRVDKARTRNQEKSPQNEENTGGAPGGTGLGLAIVQWIVQAHGGEVRVESTVGSGSLFEVRLPLLQMLETTESRKAGKEPP